MGYQDKPLVSEAELEAKRKEELKKFNIVLEQTKKAIESRRPSAKSGDNWFKRMPELERDARGVISQRHGDPDD